MVSLLMIVAILGVGIVFAATTKIVHDKSVAQTRKITDLEEEISVLKNKRTTSNTTFTRSLPSGETTILTQKTANSLRKKDTDVQILYKTKLAEVLNQMNNTDITEDTRKANIRDILANQDLTLTQEMENLRNENNDTANTDLTTEKAKSADLQQKLDTALSTANTDLTTEKAKSADLQQKLNTANTDLTTEKAKSADLQQKLDTALGTAGTANTDLTTEKAKSADLQQKLDTANTDLTTEKAKSTDLQQKLDTANTDLTTEKAKSTDLQQKLDTANTDLTTEKAKSTDLQQKIDMANTDLTTEKAKSSQLQSDKDTLNTTLSSKEQLIKMDRDNNKKYDAPACLEVINAMNIKDGEEISFEELTNALKSNYNDAKNYYFPNTVAFTWILPKHSDTSLTTSINKFKTNNPNIAKRTNIYPLSYKDRSIILLTSNTVTPTQNTVGQKIVVTIGPETLVYDNSINEYAMENSLGFINDLKYENNDQTKVLKVFDDVTIYQDSTNIATISKSNSDDTSTIFDDDDDALNNSQHNDIFLPERSVLLQEKFQDKINCETR
ncbi:protein CIP2A homolog [Aphidius gifuensis]|uniref:protein CIP2A homolog n=1 Tax=Aphidius gifuensis TaxID=684658 RepID=UPI001CDCF5BC|nr:protein CIP2A homolog [Aphidius gifuensis]